MRFSTNITAYLNKKVNCRIDCINVDVGVSIMLMLSERLLVACLGRHCSDWLCYERVSGWTSLGVVSIK